MGFGIQLKLLLWKNFTLRKRQKLRLIVEFIWPLFVFAILALVKTWGLKDFNHECHFDEKAMPSAGPLPFLQGVACTSNNTCYSTLKPDEILGAIRHFNTSLLTAFHQDLERLATEWTDVGAMPNYFEDLETLHNFQIEAANGQLKCSIQIGSVLLDLDDIRKQVQDQNVDLDLSALEDVLSTSIDVKDLLALLPSLNDLTSKKLVDVLRENIHNKLCNQNSSDILLKVAGKLPQTVLSKLCSVLQPDFLKLVEDLTQHLDISKVAEQLNQCVETTVGSRLKTISETLELYKKLISDVQSLSSFEELVQELNTTIEDSIRHFQDIFDKESTASSSIFFTRLFCGRPLGYFLAQLPVYMFDFGEEAKENNSQIQDDDIGKNIPPHEYDNTTTSFCNNVFQKLMETQGARIMYTLLKPMIRGKVLYAPDTPVTRRIIQQANTTFDNLYQLVDLANAWLAISPDIYTFMDTDPTVQTIRDMLDQVPDDPSAANLLDLLGLKNIRTTIDEADSLNSIMKLINLPDMENMGNLDSLKSLRDQADLNSLGNLVDLENLWESLHIDEALETLNELGSWKDIPISVDPGGKIQLTLGQNLTVKIPPLLLTLAQYIHNITEEPSKYTENAISEIKNYLEGLDVTADIPIIQNLLTLKQWLNNATKVDGWFDWLDFFNLTDSKIKGYLEGQSVSGDISPDLVTLMHWLYYGNEEPDWNDKVNSLAINYTEKAMAQIKNYLEGQNIHSGIEPVLQTLTHMVFNGTDELNLYILSDSISFAEIALDQIKNYLEVLKVSEDIQPLLLSLTQQLFNGTEDPNLFELLNSFHHTRNGMTELRNNLEELRMNDDIQPVLIKFTQWLHNGTDEPNWQEMLSSIDYIESTLTQMRNYLEDLNLRDDAQPILHKLTQWLYNGTNEPTLYNFLSSINYTEDAMTQIKNYLEVLKVSEDIRPLLLPLTQQLFNGTKDPNLFDLLNSFHHTRNGMTELRNNLEELRMNDDIQPVLVNFTQWLHNGTDEPNWQELSSSIDYIESTLTQMRNYLEDLNLRDDAQPVLHKLTQWLYNGTNEPTLYNFLSSLNYTEDAMTQIKNYLETLDMSDNIPAILLEFSRWLYNGTSEPSLFGLLSPINLTENALTSIKNYLQIMKLSIGIRPVILKLTQWFYNGTAEMNLHQWINAVNSTENAITQITNYLEGLNMSDSIKPVIIKLTEWFFNGTDEANLHNLLDSINYTENALAQIKTALKVLKMNGGIQSILRTVTKELHNLTEGPSPQDLLKYVNYTENAMNQIYNFMEDLDMSDVQPVLLTFIQRVYNETQKPTWQAVLKSISSKDNALTQMKKYFEELSLRAGIPPDLLTWWFDNGPEVPSWYKWRETSLSYTENALTEIRDHLERIKHTNISDYLPPMLLTLKHWLYNGPKQPGRYDWRDSLKSTDNVLTHIKNYLQCFEFDKFKGYATEDDLVKAGQDLLKTKEFWAGIVFENLDAAEQNEVLPTHISFKIRMDSEKVDSTSDFKVLDRYWRPGPRFRPIPDLLYITYGFSYLQDMVEHAIIREHTGLSPEDDIGIEVKQFPYPCYISDRFITIISDTLSLFMVLAWIYTVSMIVKDIVYEKECRLKEMMKVMGLGNAVHWVAWSIICLLIMIIITVILLLILKFGNVLEKSNPMVLFVFMLAFAVATMMQCFMYSVFFSRANLAAVSAGIIYFCTYMVFRFVYRWSENMTRSQKLASCLFSNVAFGFGCSYIVKYEEMAVGIQWHNIDESPLPDDRFSMLGTIYMMLLDIVLYGLVTWYVETVFPGQYGIPRKWYFLVTRSYWCGTDTATDGIQTLSPSEGDPASSENFEKEPSQLPCGVSIQGLCKTYARGKKMAVDGLNLNFYEGQITSFLGHNGAGKTTTMSVLTGLFPPTAGSVMVYGMDIRSDIQGIRRSMGMCPQHNILFDELTVEEHLWFYGQLKGGNKKSLTDEINQIIIDCGLSDKHHETSTNLSGGMKRKLSVGIAFVADSRVIILDEPTAGVDPYARRSIWELLLKNRKGRTIILSTHFMDEADILGDRIAIISQGKLCCSGSSLFLKNRFGSGYYLTLVKAEGSITSDSSSSISTAGSSTSSVRKGKLSISEDEGVADLSMSGSHSEDSSSFSIAQSASGMQVTDFIQHYVKSAKLVEDLGTEMCYQLPAEGAHNGDFEKLFTALDSNLSTLQISSYGISDTSLEEVFLTVADATGVDEVSENKREKLEQLTDGGDRARPVSRLSFRQKKQTYLGHKMENKNLTNNMEEASLKTCNSTGGYQVTGLTLRGRQILAIWIKRFHNVRRSKKAFITEILLPVGFVCLAMVLAILNPPTAEQPPMELHPWLLMPKKSVDPHLSMFYSNDHPGMEWTDKLESLLIQKPGIGTRCMDPELHTILKHPCVEVEDGKAKWTKPSMAVNDTLDCSCDTGVQVCPNGAGSPNPPKVMLPSSDYLYNTTGRNISDWLVKTMNEYIKQRYGGLSFGEENPVIQVNKTVQYLHQLMTAAYGGKELPFDITIPPFLYEVDSIVASLATRRNAKIWFNNKGYSAMVSYMNVMNNLILRAHLPPEVDPSKYGIAVTNHPMDKSKEQLAEFIKKESMQSLMIAICIIFALSFIPASFILYLVEERVSNSKHLQFVSGLNPTIYWLSNYCWDMVNYAVPTVLCIFILLAFQHEAYVSKHNAPCLVLLLFLYGWAVTPMMYPASFLFKVPSTAFVTLAAANVFLGMLSMLDTAIFEFLLEEDEELQNIHSSITKALLILPHYCLVKGLIDMATNQLYSDVMDKLGEQSFRNPLEWTMVGRNLVFLFVEGFVFFALTLAIEYKFWFNKMNCSHRDIKEDSFENHTKEDADVTSERQRIKAGNTQGDILTIEDLTKVYGRTKKRDANTVNPAVNRICLGVHKGECFGLLGVNGAGKTTTFKMLTGDIGVTSGKAHLDGFSILTDMVSFRQHLGYCPQFDAIVPLLSGREHLQLYARLRGVPENEVNTVAEWGIHHLGLLQYADKCAGDYSGGNKRKLSTAIALVGNPPVVLLDEPTTGMDPKARRFLWDCIGKIIKDGRSVVLTSHSMEECEALCSRIAIMVNGEFKCLGSIQHLKNRFGNGYTIIMRVSGQGPDMAALNSYIKETFPKAELQENHHNMVQYQLGTGETSLAHIFSVLESAKERLSIEDYSVSQTTLDQVFINFAKLQSDLSDDKILTNQTVKQTTSLVNPNQPTKQLSAKQLPQHTKVNLQNAILSETAPKKSDYPEKHNQDYNQLTTDFTGGKQKSIISLGAKSNKDLENLSGREVKLIPPGSRPVSGDLPEASSC